MTRPVFSPPKLIEGARSRFLAAQRFDAGRVGPPADRAKRRHLLDLFQKREHRIFVESGTYLGDTVAAFLPHASRIVSVEIDPHLHAAAAARFAGDAQVEIILGDAVEHVPRALAELSEPCLLWLDGHFSGEGTGKGEILDPAPLILDRLGELDLPAGTTIVVDDLRLFGVLAGFPTLEALVGSAKKTLPGARLSVGPDCLVVRG